MWDSHDRLGGAADRIGACGVRNEPTIPTWVERKVVASRLPTLGIRDPDLEESRVAIDTNAILVERNARSSLPLGDGGGQQLSCRCYQCDTAHWTQPRRKTVPVASEG